LGTKQNIEVDWWRFMLLVFAEFGGVSGYKKKTITDL
jgi:hypothetical protein